MDVFMIRFILIIAFVLKKLKIKFQHIKFNKTIVKKKKYCGVRF